MFISQNQKDSDPARCNRPMELQVQEQIPMKKMGLVDDVAAAVSFLAGEESGYITGQVLCIDGGLSM